MIKQLSLSRFIQPKEKNKDSARREYILNVLLFGSMALSGLATLSAFIGDITKNTYPDSAKEVFFIFLFFLSCYLFSRNGFSRHVSYLLIFLYFFVTTNSAYRWGASVPQGLLTYSLIIIMSGILINSFFSFIMTILTSFTIILLIYVQSNNLIEYSSWIDQTTNIRDGIVFSITFFIITLVSWLSNKEMEQALRRARVSEMELKVERDTLEVKVEERTRELQKSQLERTLQLHHFAQFGQMASGLFHDLASPVTLISFNLDTLKNTAAINTQEFSEAKHAIDRAIIGIKRLELFIQGARKQLQQQEVREQFSLSREIQEALDILEHKAHQLQVHIQFNPKHPVTTVGNPIKFNKVIMNIVGNAIDAYEGLKNKTRKIAVHLDVVDERVSIRIQDWAIGIPPGNLKKIFEPLFTTKSASKGMGMGLSIARDIIEGDFGGSIVVVSAKGKGTMFTIEFPTKKA